MNVIKVDHIVITHAFYLKRFYLSPKLYSYKQRDVKELSFSYMAAMSQLQFQGRFSSLK